MFYRPWSTFWSGGELFVDRILKKTDDDPEMVIISIERSFDPEQIVATVLEKQIAHFIQNERDLRSELSAVSTMVNETSRYFTDLSVVILPNVQHEKRWDHAEKLLKADLKSQILEFFAARGNRACLESIDATFEELYMNAKIDAPSNAKRNPSEANFSFICAAGETDGVIGCWDPFGSLNLHSFVRRMNEIYKKGRGEGMNFGAEGGAGIGCVILFEKCAGLYLGVEEEVQTLVACRIPLKMSGRQRAELPKSLHLIHKKKTGS